MLSSARPTPACRPPPPARRFRFPTPPPPPTPHIAPPPLATPRIPPAAPSTPPPGDVAACRRAWLTWRRCRARRHAARRTSAAATRLAARRLARHVLRQWWERTIAAAATAWAARLHAARAAARRHLAAWAEAIARRQSARFWQWHAARQHHLLACRRATRRRAASLRRLAAAAADRSDSRATRLLALAHHRLAATRRAWHALRRLRWLAPSRALHALPTLRGWQPEVRGWRAWRDAFRRAELTAAASVGAGGRKEAALLAALHARRAALLRGMCAWVWRVRAAAAARRREERARAPAALRRAVRAWVRRLPRLAAAEARRARVRLLVGRRRREGFGAALARLRLAAEREGREGRAAAWRRRVHTRRAWRRWRRHTARERRLLSLLKPSVSIRPILCGVREQRMFDALRRGFGKWFSRWRRGRLDAIAEARAARRWEWRQIGRAQIAVQALAAWALTQRLSTRARDWQTRRRKRYGWGRMVRRCRVWAVCAAMMGLVLRPVRRVRPGVVGHAKRVDTSGSSLSSFVHCTRLSPLSTSARLPLSRVYELILRWRHQNDRARRLAGWLARQHRKALICVLYRWLENQDWRRMKRRRRKKANLRDLIWM